MGWWSKTPIPMPAPGTAGWTGGRCGSLARPAWAVTANGEFAAASSRFGVVDYLDPGAVRDHLHRYGENPTGKGLVALSLITIDWLLREYGV